MERDHNNRAGAGDVPTFNICERLVSEMRIRRSSLDPPFCIGERKNNEKNLFRRDRHSRYLFGRRVSLVAEACAAGAKEIPASTEHRRLIRVQLLIKNQ
jgi:hypothetical protein